ncbi:hypothetical protein F4W66_24660 (plasmid) [Escherichia coli]|nr:hypothetical protein F4W66_24660 [Escherichia coli]
MKYALSTCLGYPKSVCILINEVVKIRTRIMLLLKEMAISLILLDAVIKDGFHGDTPRKMFIVGTDHHGESSAASRKRKPVIRAMQVCKTRMTR